MHWVLPDHIQDALPAEAAEIERLRRHALDTFRGHGYELVMPPMLEYLDSLSTGVGEDLDLKTFKLVDQLSGRTLGVRADTTPQVARIDAHLLNRRGVTRLCYCGSVLHTLPSTLTATREPLQLGAELYGHDGIEADAEIIRLLANVMKGADLAPARIDLGHVGLFRALMQHGGMDAATEERLFELLRRKDVPALQEALVDADETVRAAVLALPTLYGSLDVLDRAARELPALPEIARALGEIRRLAQLLGDLPVCVDLADLRGYHYHNGVVFAAYVEDLPAAIALGGRYDGAGAAFGRERAATGFSLDLRELALRSRVEQRTGAILAPAEDEAALRAEVVRLRAAGEIVVDALPGHTGTWMEAGCDRKLIKRGETWVVTALQEDV